MSTDVIRETLGIVYSRGGTITCAMKALTALETGNAAMRDALTVCLGHLTGGMDGDWRDCDPVEIARAALTSTPTGVLLSREEANAVLESFRRLIDGDTSDTALSIKDLLIERLGGRDE